MAMFLSIKDQLLSIQARLFTILMFGHIKIYIGQLYVWQKRHMQNIRPKIKLNRHANISNEIIIQRNSIIGSLFRIYSKKFLPA